MRQNDVRERVYQRVRKVVSEVLRVSEERITPESRYLEDLNADSFDNLSLLLALEEEFDRTIDGEAVTHLSTVGATVDFILGQAEAPAPSPAP